MKEVAALYARVSTRNQEQEATIESQVAEIETYARKNEYELMAEIYYLDEAVSGSRLERPALDRLRDRATEGIFTKILCLSPDRLARQYVHQQVLLDELSRIGVEMIFINQPAQVEGPQGELLLGIQGLFAEYERAMITERLRRGKLYRIRQGQLMSPSPPYGYRYIPVSEAGGGRWHIDERNAEMVRQIYEWYTVEQLTISAIVNQLNASGVERPMSAPLWTYSGVRNILRQQAYTGKGYYNRTRSNASSVGRPRKSGRGHLSTPEHQGRPQEEWIEVSTPVILEKEIWQQAQEQLQMNQRFSVRNNKRNFYLLRGLLVCSTCGRTLIGRTNHKGSSYYCANGGKNRSPDVPVHRCTIAGPIVEPLVWSEIVRLLRNPTLVADAWQNQHNSGQIPPNEIERLQSRQRKLKRQWIRVLDLYQEGLIDKPELENRKSRLDDELNSLEVRLKELSLQNRQIQTQEKVVQNFASFAKKIDSSLASPSPELQQEIIRLLIDHVVVEQDAIVIKHIVPADDDRRLTLGHREAIWRCHPLVRRARLAVGVGSLWRHQHLQPHRTRRAVHAGGFHRLAAGQPGQYWFRARLRNTHRRGTGAGSPGRPTGGRRIPEVVALCGCRSHLHRWQILRRFPHPVRPYP
ncbi:MAG: recombinase family protein [Chloroflexi bacterium]|nr:recombinase family protein [Chloroflexota bacterium]